MNFGTITGISIAGIVLVSAMASSAVDPWIFWNPAGLMIVIGGTFASAFIAFQFRDVMRIFWIFYIILRNERLYPKRDTQEILRIAKAWAKNDIRAISTEIATVTNPFLRLGIELATDATTPDQDIADVLRYRIQKLRNAESAQAAVLRAMAAFAPAFGMLGTLLGLINMLRNAGADDFDLMMANMAVALMTTLYGIVLANLLFKPMALKFEYRTRRRVAHMNLILEGLLLMRRQRSPGVVREMMRIFSAEHSDELEDGTAAQAKERSDGATK